ncbi:MAG: hypothetical protein FWF76_01415 [Oscillospiraceae bacterium]|nr:hypothetical protein [Oscillospiraceae bacterium]
MKKSKYTKIIKRIARENNITVNYVRNELRMAIHIAYENRNSNSTFWEQWGRKPALDEFLEAVNENVFNRLIFGE